MGEVARRLEAGEVAVKGAKGSKAAGALVVMNANIVPLYQSHVSLSAKVGAGKALDNPIARIPIKFNEDGTVRRGFEAFDLTKKLPPPEGSDRPCFAELLFDGAPLSANNVHHIRGGSENSGLVNLGTVCFSTMGISIPVTLECLFVRPPVAEKDSMADLFGDF